MTQKIRLLDTFAGIGGFHYAGRDACKALGLEFECVGAIEIDKVASETYALNHPGTPLITTPVSTTTIKKSRKGKNGKKDTPATEITTVKHKGDITKIDLTTLPEHDLLCGGFPCQAFSNNRSHNKRGTDLVVGKDPREVLYTYLGEILRIHKPKFFLFENVRDLSKSKAWRETFKAILECFRQNGQYKVYTDVLDSRHFGVPQMRKRTYIVGIRSDIESAFTFDTFNKEPCAPVSLEAFLESDVSDKYSVVTKWKKTLCKRNGQISRLEAIEKSLAARDTKVEDYGKNVPIRIAEITGDAGAVEGGKISKNQERGKKVYSLDENSDSPSRQSDRLYSHKGISTCLTTFSNASPAFDFPSGWRRLTPRECHNLQGFPAEHKMPSNDAEAYKQAGNAITVNVARHVLTELLKLSK
jgi:DNA (cytosine-5)-methyltransferase 1